MNNKLMMHLSEILNNNPNFITSEMLNDLSDNFSEEESMAIILAGAMDLYDDKETFINYIKPMIKKQNIREYQNNAYYQNIKLDNIVESNWRIKKIKYQPYELFVYDDLKECDGKVIPSIGYFDEEYEYPCIYQNNREWMLITPNEINTMKKPIDEAFGHVVTYGLGLGYYAYMVSLKDNVEKVTIIKNDINVINLFKRYIYPQFTNKDKIEIICEDALKYHKKKLKSDYVFIDIYHDPIDAIDIYLECKKYERVDTKYAYWIEDTIKYYI